MRRRPSRIKGTAAALLAFLLTSCDLSSAQDYPRLIEVVVQAGGQIHWSGEPVTLAEFEHRLEVAAQRTPQPTITIQPARDATISDVAAVFAVIQRSELDLPIGILGGTS